jgi:uncharacterized membrane protein
MEVAESAVERSWRGIAGALLCGVGAGLSGYSVLVKLAAVPCFSASCGAVINSAYGAVWGVPVGLLGLLAWGAFPWVPPMGRRLLKAGLVTGSVAFIWIQALVLRQFCPICMAHAAACFLVAPLPVPKRLTSATVYLGLGLALAAAVVADGWNRRQLLERIGEGSAAAQEAPSMESIPGVPWLSSVVRPETRLVISLTCGQCQRILQEILAEGGGDRPTAPLVFLSEEGHAEVTRLALAAVLSVPEPGRVEGFARALSILLGDPAILARDDAATAGFLLSGDFPDLEAHLTGADALLAAHAKILHDLGIEGTPALIVDGRPAPYDRSWARAER